MRAKAEHNFANDERAIEADSQRERAIELLWCVVMRVTMRVIVRVMVRVRTPRRLRRCTVGSHA